MTGTNTNFGESTLPQRSSWLAAGERLAGPTPYLTTRAAVAQKSGSRPVQRHQPHHEGGVSVGVLGIDELIHLVGLWWGSVATFGITRERVLLQLRTGDVRMDGL